MPILFTHFPDQTHHLEEAVTLYTFAAGVINGMLLGGLYALTAVGLAVIFGVLRLINIPHGEFLVLGAYLSFFIATGLGLDPLLTVLIVAPGLFCIGYGIQRWLLHPAMSGGSESVLLTAFGLSIIGQSLFRLLWGVNTRTITTSYSDQGVNFAGVRVPCMYLVAFGAAVVVLSALQVFITHTYLGKAIRAAAQDPDTAQVMGINVKSVYALTYAIGAGITALGGTLLGMIYAFVPASGLSYLLKGFVVVVLGGMGSMVGTLLGGMLLGVLEGLGAAMFGTGYRELIGLLMSLAVLVVRPTGLFGRTAIP
jgi:branched-chain amino acid transport system permease protein